MYIYRERRKYKAKQEEARLLAEKLEQKKNDDAESLYRRKNIERKVSTVKIIHRVVVSAIAATELVFLLQSSSGSGSSSNNIPPVLFLIAVAAQCVFLGLFIGIAPAGVGWFIHVIAFWKDSKPRCYGSYKDRVIFGKFTQPPEIEDEISAGLKFALAEGLAVAVIYTLSGLC